MPLRAAALLLLVSSLALSGCVGGDRTPASAQPIRVDDEPPMAEDWVGAVPDQEGQDDLGFEEADGAAEVEEEMSEEPSAGEEAAGDEAGGEEEILDDGDDGGDGVEIEPE